MKTNNLPERFMKSLHTANFAMRSIFVWMVWKLHVVLHKLNDRFHHLAHKTRAKLIIQKLQRGTPSYRQFLDGLFEDIECGKLSLEGDLHTSADEISRLARWNALVLAKQLLKELQEDLTHGGTMRASILLQKLSREVRVMNIEFAEIGLSPDEFMKLDTAVQKIETSTWLDELRSSQECDFDIYNVSKPDWIESFQKTIHIPLDELKTSVEELGQLWDNNQRKGVTFLLERLRKAEFPFYQCDVDEIIEVTKRLGVTYEELGTSIDELMGFKYKTPKQTTA